ncbi:MAG: alpha/beta hydrolase [Rhabdochlamydiaceae bacterium]|nr:alpha/beta hydrolase [Candidatus Amphrikana amoebophyrae]
MPILKTSEFEIYYEVHGENKPPLLLLSGMGRDHSVWDNYIQFLEPIFQVITIDNLGAGQTKCFKENFSMQDMANATKKVLEHLGSGSIYLLGHSMGGYIAQNFCLQYPNAVKKMALFSTTAYQGKVARVSTDTVIELRKRQVPYEFILNSFIPLAFSSHFLNIEGVFEKILEEMSNNISLQSEKDFQRQAAACRAHDTRSQLNCIKLPTLICTGELDVLSTVDDSKFLAQHIEGSQLEIVQNVAHEIQIENGEKFISLVLNFFSSE